MNTTHRTFLLAALATLMPAIAQAAPPAGGPGGDTPPPPPVDGKNPPPPHPNCTYSAHTCLVSTPDLSFVVSKVNDITPSSDNDCKLLPPCGHRPPPPLHGPGENQHQPDDNGPPPNDNAN